MFRLEIRRKIGIEKGAKRKERQKKERKTYSSFFFSASPCLSIPGIYTYIIFSFLFLFVLYPNSSIYIYSILVSSDINIIHNDSFLSMLYFRFHLPSPHIIIISTLFSFSVSSSLHFFSFFFFFYLYAKSTINYLFTIIFLCVLVWNITVFPLFVCLLILHFINKYTKQTKKRGKKN